MNRVDRDFLEAVKERGICPKCEGYGGREVPDGHQSSECPGTCPECWCPGCHDGQDFPESRLHELDDGDPCGSWLAYEHLKQRKAERPIPGQVALPNTGGNAEPEVYDSTPWTTFRADPLGGNSES